MCGNDFSDIRRCTGTLIYFDVLVHTSKESFFPYKSTGTVESCKKDARQIRFLEKITKMCNLSAKIIVIYTKRALETQEKNKKPVFLYWKNAAMQKGQLADGHNNKRFP